MERCGWCGSDPLYVTYHDTEWGVPVRDDRRQFEFLILESAQAGLSWITVLRKREGYREAFYDFDPVKVAAMTGEDVERLMHFPGIVRNRAKITAAIGNARAFLKIVEETGSFSDWLWSFVDGVPVQGAMASLSEVPAVTPLAERVSKALKARGFKFVGPTIVYAHLQATGLVNDHLTGCFRHREVQGL